MSSVVGVCGCSSKQASLFCCRCIASLVPPLLLTAAAPAPRLPALPPSHLLQKLTFLRMGDMMIDNWTSFGAFLQRLTCPAQP